MVVLRASILWRVQGSGSSGNECKSCPRRVLLILDKRGPPVILVDGEHRTEKFWANCRQPFSYRITEGLPVIHPQS